MPARQGIIPAQPSSGRSPVAPEVSLVSSPARPMPVPVPVPSMSITVAAGRARCLPAVTAQAVVSQARTPSAPMTDSTTG